MEITKEQLQEMFVMPGHISEEKFQELFSSASKNEIPFEQLVVEEGLVSDVNVGRTIADYFDYHFADLHTSKIEEDYLTIIPESVAYAQSAIIFEVTDNTIKVATNTFDYYEFVKLLEKKTGKKVVIYYTTHANLQEAFTYYKGDYRQRIIALIEKVQQNQEDGHLVSFVDLLLEYAHTSRASDIHIEPTEKDILVRFRVDGLLHEAIRYPSILHPKVVFRIKIMSRMQTDEHASAQDGRFEYVYDKTTFDVRVSMLPITNGENVVMRLLSSEVRQYTLENLGFREEDYKRVIEATKKTSGMIMAVGPTGSGKSTLLYSVLEKLNTPEINIMTIEDPVEYDIEGVQQTQVNISKKLTFSTGLRSIVRQDPDIIMVGEIRDEETADISINSALTGHLVLSTLHTNDAATTFPRLAEMGVEAFLVASSVQLIISLRLVRKICDHCKESYLPDENELKILELYPDVEIFLKEIASVKNIKDIRMYRGAGCKVCNQTGYVGRIGLFETLQTSEEIRLLLTQKASSDVINEKAKELGMTSLLYDGVTKVLNGTTTLSEVIKSARI